MQIYRWEHFTRQLRQETGSREGSPYTASRTSVVRAFWKAQLFLAVHLQSMGVAGAWQSLGCHTRFANQS